MNLAINGIEHLFLYMGQIQLLANLLKVGFYLIDNLINFVKHFNNTFNSKANYYLVNIILHGFIKFDRLKLVCCLNLLVI